MGGFVITPTGANWCDWGLAQARGNSGGALPPCRSWEPGFIQVTSSSTSTEEAPHTVFGGGGGGGTKLEIGTLL